MNSPNSIKVFFSLTVFFFLYSVQTVENILAGEINGILYVAACVAVRPTSVVVVVALLGCLVS